MLHLVLVTLLLPPSAQSSQLYDDIKTGRIPYNQDSLLKFLDKMSELNKIQAQILDVPVPEAFHDAPLIHSIQHEGTSKPDQKPYLFEGDMVLTEEQMNIVVKNVRDQYWARKLPAAKKFISALRGKRSLTSDLALRWTFPIPYYIDTTTGVDVDAVQAGITKWQEETCVTFTQLEQQVNYNSLTFIQGSGCWSYIGKIGSSSQQVSIGNGCTSLGTVTHEIGHALGFYHEQSRYDRDSYVSIVTQNIESAYLSQFTKQSFSSMIDYGIGYDYGSVMHYDQYAFSSSGGNTIATLDANYQATIGQRVEPSFMDVKRINFAYCNSSCVEVLPCQNGGYTDPKNCSSCRCPTGLGGTFCTQADSNPAGCGTGSLIATNSSKSIAARGNINCNYYIQAPAGTKVYFQLTSASFTRSVPCSYNYLEIKYVSELERVGARFCTSFPTISVSDSNKLVIIYKGGTGAYFTLNYRYDPVDANVTPLTTTTTPLPTTTKASTTSTTTESVPETTSASTTASTTQSTTTQTTTTTTTTTTTAPTTTTTLASTCGEWTDCSAQCGGCGTRSRRCNRYIETVYCNTTPCGGGYCCRPFFYSNGVCTRPQQYDTQNQTIVEPTTSEDAPSRDNLLLAH